MYASYNEVRLKSGKTAEAIEITKDLIPQIGEIPNLRQFILIDKGDDNALLLAFYNTAEEQEAASPRARELLGRLADLFAGRPERTQMEVPINHTYLTSPAGG